MAKNPPTVQETWVPSLGKEDPLEKEMETHSSILARKLPWTEEPGGLQSMGLWRVRHYRATSIYFDWVCAESGGIEMISFGRNSFPKGLNPLFFYYCLWAFWLLNKLTHIYKCLLSHFSLASVCIMVLCGSFNVLFPHGQWDNHLFICLLAICPHWVAVFQEHFFAWREYIGGVVVFPDRPNRKKKKKKNPQKQDRTVFS